MEQRELLQVEYTYKRKIVQAPTIFLVKSIRRKLVRRSQAVSHGKRCETLVLKVGVRTEQIARL